MTYRTINIKQDMPTTDYAIHLMLEEIKLAKFTGEKVIVVIHGYGSHGVGGLIKQEVHKTLVELKRRGQITDFVTGEQWQSDAALCRQILSYNPDIEIAHDLHLHNIGVTVILV